MVPAAAEVFELPAHLKLIVMNSSIQCSLLLLSLELAAPAATVVNIKTGTLAGVTLQNQAGTALDGGSVSNGDGTLLEFGYYFLGATATPFSGAWTPLTGPQSESLIDTTIGDGWSGADGIFTFTFQLNLSLASLPADGTPLVMRYYDATNRASSMAFNAVANTDGTWNWNSTAFQINMSVGDEPGTIWQDGAASAYRTTIPIPEPSGILMLGSAVVGWCLRRRS